MIKKTARGIGRMIKPFVNFPAWIGVKHLKEDQARLNRLAKSVLMPHKVATYHETYEAAVARLGLDESMLQARLRSFKQLTIFYLIIAALLVIYALYLLVIVGAVLGFLMALSAVWISLVLAFKQHFWYTQMKVQRLGLTLREWLWITLHRNQGV